MPARKARGAIVEKGEEACKVIGDYLNSAAAASTPNNCGSWLACDGGGTGNISVDWYTVIAGKPGSHRVLRCYQPFFTAFLAPR